MATSPRSPRTPRFRRRCWCCPWKHVARGFEAVAATVYGHLDEDDSDFEEEPMHFTSKSPDAARERGFSGTGDSGDAGRAERLESCLEFFDAIDEDEMSEPENSIGASVFLPKLKTDEDIAANYGIPLISLKDLKQQFPECPAAELARFLARKSVSGDPKKGAKLIDGYLAWRRDELANYPPTKQGFDPPFRFNGVAKDGSRLLFGLPCVMDPGLHPDVYVHFLARLLDKELDRADSNRMTVLLDVRGHQPLGYEGKPVWKMWSHIKAMAKIFQGYFPERLQRFVIYPAGDVEMGAFRMFKALFSKETMKRVTVLHDKEGCFAPTPPKDLLQYIELNEIFKENQIFFKGLDDNKV